MTLHEILDYFKDLQENNQRDWFKQHEARYKDAKSSFEVFVDILINEIRGFDPEIGALEAKQCTFRIYRDVRFSKNKEPYKTHFGAYIAKGGHKSPYAGYYIHMEPGSSFVGGGLHMPQPNILKAVRKQIFADPNEFLQLINEKSFKAMYPEIYGEKLKTAPQGYPKDFEHIDLLNHKHYSIVSPLDENIWQNPELVTKITEAFKVQYNFNQYLNEIVNESIA